VVAVLILLPPSEGKSAPRRGAPLALSRLAFPTLEPARAELLDALVSLCAGDREKAAEVLGLGSTQQSEVDRDAALPSAATARADHVYSGVLYEALGLPELPAAAKRRATSRLVIVSGLFGLVRPDDRIPAYRLSGQVTLPGIGAVARYWGARLAPAVEEAAGDGLVVDLRSSAYAPFWRPEKARADRVVTVRVLQESGGQRKVVSRFNKATKGRMVRDLLLAGAAPRRPAQLVEALRDLGWRTEEAGSPHRLDVVVTEL
jgi:uncharacterized protein